ncbi:MAG TPA: hypothetical protein PKZ12_02550 [Smithellaceae bacterium]|nr:hypothetical protein [Smithellaceae bacterium]
MQSEIIFSENIVQTQAARSPEILQSIKSAQKFRKFIECSDWDVRLLDYEKYLNRFSWAVIIASVLYLLPICVTILL